MKRYLVEFIGTFFLILTVVCTVTAGVGSFAPLAIGSVLMVMIYAGGHISGGHFNPAVTLGVFLRGKIGAADIPGYMIAQLAGGALAAFTGLFIAEATVGADYAVATGDFVGAGNMVPGLLAEFLGTFALVYVILNVATSKSTDGNSFYGLAIGFTVLACAYALGGVTGGAFNPAVALGVSLAGMQEFANIWVYLVANFLGGAVAAFVYRFVYNDDEA